MKARHLTVWFLLASASVALAEGPSSAFRPLSPGIYQFDSSLLRGVLKLDGKFQGLYPLYDVASGAELTRAPGVFSPYRIFSGAKRFGNAARDWTTESRSLADGSVEVRWPAAKEHPLEIAAEYRWSAPDTLDAIFRVKPQQDMPRFELFMSSYFTQNFRASVYMAAAGDKNAGFVPIDRGPEERGAYVMFPRDQAAVDHIRDGRWKIPPSPVDWDIRRGMAAPLAIRRDDVLGLTAVMMCPPADCFAVASPWNPATAEARGYRSLYLSLFGQDLKAGQEAMARCRLVVARNLTDQQAVRCYEQYLKVAGSGKQGGGK